MKINTHELQGTALDWAVTKLEAERKHFTIYPEFIGHYSTDWAEGGPIIERERINIGLSFDGSYCEGSFAEPTAWCAYRHRVGGPINPPRYRGPTPLIAAMRCYVASKLGDQIDIPDKITP